MKRPELNGRACLGLVRCSKDEQTETSIPDQRQLLKSFAKENGLAYVGDVVLDGISGSVPGARNDIDIIMRRKKTRNDFDVLLVQDVTRLTRAGAGHGMKLVWDLGAIGVEVVFTNEQFAALGDYGNMAMSMGFDAARHTAKSISLASTRGSMTSLTERKMVACCKVPYGIDRLYSTADGRTKHIIRNLGDGTQQMLDPENGSVKATYARNEKKRKSNHYRRQPDERISLIPGAPARVEAVRLAYRRHFEDGWGPYRIAAEFNSLGIECPTGTFWTISSVKRLLENTIYTGKTIANRYTNALFNMRSAEGPTPVHTTTQAIANSKHLKYKIRPREDWVMQDHPRLADFLDPAIKQLASVKHEQILNALLKKPVAKPCASKHSDSEFVLRGIMKCKQGGYSMTGRVTNKKKTGAKFRYYGIGRGVKTPIPGSIHSKMVRAEPIEKAVLGIVHQVMQEVDLRDRLQKGIQAQRELVTSDSESMEALEKEEAKLGEQLVALTVDMGPLGRELVRKKAEQVELQLQQLKARIDKAKTAATATVDDEALIEAMMAELKSLGNCLDALSNSGLRSVVETLVKRLEVDLETLAFDLEIAVPAGLAFEEPSSVGPVCLTTSSLQRTVGEANLEKPLEIGVFRCESPGKKVCYTCRRAA